MRGHHDIQEDELYPMPHENETVNIKYRDASLKQNFESTKDRQLNKLVEALTKFQLSIPHSSNIFSSAFNDKNLQRTINSLGSDISNSWGDMFATLLDYPCQHRKLAKTH